MRVPILPVLAVSMLCAAANAGPGDVQRGKAATALVSVDGGRATGTAFCIDPSGVFVTNAHVIHGAGAFQVVVNPGGKDERTVFPGTVSVSREKDIALFTVWGDQTYPFLELGEAAALKETDELTIFGFPFGSVLTVEAGSNPAISVNTGHVTALRKAAGVLELIQLDAAINPGNSGGPVMGRTGRVVGVVTSRIGEAGLGFAVPIEHVREVAREPLIDIQGIELKGQTLRVRPRVYAVGRAGASVNVEVLFGIPGKDVQRVTATRAAKSSYSASVTLPAAADSEMVSITIAVTSGDKTIGEKHTTLAAELARANPAVPQATPEAGPRKAAEPARKGPAGPDGGTEARPRAAPRRDQAPAAPVVKAAASPVFEGDSKTIQAPGGFEDVVIAAGGRYLLFPMSGLRSVAVFDVTAAAFVKHLPVDTDRMLVAGGASYAMVVDRARGLLHRFSLSTFQRELTTQLQTQGEITGIAMGSASDGPLCVMIRPRSPGAPYQFIDPRTHKELPLKLEGNVSVSDGGHVRAAPGGRVFGAWRDNASPTGVQVMTIGGDAVRIRYEHDSASYIQPSDDGLVYTGMGVLRGDLKTRLLPAYQLTSPSVDGNFYITSAHDQAADAPRQAQVYVAGESTPFLTFDLGEELFARSHSRAEIAADHRLIYIPSAKVLVLAPQGNDRVVVRRFDPVAELTRLGVDYLFVSSRAPLRAIKGREYSYQVTAECKNGPVAYKLDSGPAGMSISQSGLLTWRIPPAFPQQSAPVILTVSDALGQERFHSYLLEIE
jgi:S1-C subfamily serine protease